MFCNISKHFQLFEVMYVAPTALVDVRSISNSWLSCFTKMLSYYRRVTFRNKCCLYMLNHEGCFRRYLLYITMALQLQIKAAI